MKISQLDINRFTSNGGSSFDRRTWQYKRMREGMRGNRDLSPDLDIHPANQSLRIKDLHAFLSLSYSSIN